MTARAVTSSVPLTTSGGIRTPLMRRGAPPLALSGSSGGIIEKKLCESKYCCNFAVMESVCAPWSAIKRERRANRRQYPLL